MAAHAAAASNTIIGIAIVETAVPLTPYSSECTNRTDLIAAANSMAAPASIEPMLDSAGVCPLAPSRKIIGR